jgi:hypothetical protein
MSEKDQLRNKLMHDTYSFGKYVLDFNLFTDIHKDLADFLDKDQRTYRGQTLFKMILMSRGTFKSSLGVLSYATRRLIENPELRILIYSAEYGLSERSLRFIKGSLENNHKLKELFGEHRNDSEWTNRSIVSSQRTKTQRDPSITIGGTNAQLTGFHYDLIICDDIFGNKNTENVEQIKKVKEQFAALMPLLDRHNGGEIVVIGTIWHHNDLYMDKLTCSTCGHIETGKRGVLEKACSECGSEREWDIMYMPAWDGDLDETHVLNFPTILTDDILGQIRKEMYDATGSEYSFSCQYALRPIADEERLFHREDFRYFSADSRGTYGLPSGVRYSITMDPAAGKKRDSSNTAINISAFTPHGQWYLIHSEMGKWSEDERIDIAMDWIRRTGCRDFGIEVTGSANLAEIFEREFRRAHVHVKVHEIKHYNRPKAERVASMARFYRRGDIFHPKFGSGNLSQGVRTYETGLLGCSRTIVPEGSDDVDAMAMQMQMPASSSFQSTASAREYRATHRLDELEARAARKKIQGPPNSWMEC